MMYYISLSVQMHLVRELISSFIWSRHLLLSLVAVILNSEFSLEQLLCHAEQNSETLTQQTYWILPEA